jgi:gliding motility-associated-like protein
VIAYSGISCFDIKDTTIIIYRTPAVQFDVLNKVCENTPSFLITQASETSGLSGVAVFNGKGVSTSGLFNPAIAGSGIYSIKYTFTSDAGCPADAEQMIQINPKPSVNAGPDRVIIKGGGILLQAQASGNNLSFNWFPPDYVDQPQVLTPRAYPPSSQVFTLKATSADGCSNVDSVLITVLDGFYIPNAFTPNGDGLNDVWRLPYLDAYPHMQVRVFNRWGQVVYQSAGPDVKWDGNMNGQQLPSGVYAYVIDLRDGGVVYKGTVTIIR